MTKIEHFSNLHVSRERSIERIIAAARAEPGLWLMVKEREMELRAMRAELKRLRADENEIDNLFPERLTPTLADLAEELLTRMFGNCPQDMLAPAQDALLAAAKLDLDRTQ